MNIQLLALIFIAIFAIVIKYNTEKFDIPLKSSSAWDWNTGPGYGAGYGTGYSMWGMWPSTLPRIPWRNWMWGRRPLVFASPFTPVPQVDYNMPQSNFAISLLSINGQVKVAVDGIPGKTLQLDRNRPYYFNIYTPNTIFSITDGKKVLFETTNKVVKLTFDNTDAQQLYYTIANDPNSGGIIYLNHIR